MKTTGKCALLALIVFAIAAYHARRTSACSPGAFMPEPIFVNILHPDLPITDYTNGNLGVIEPTYASIYLYVAYRNLAGHPLSPSDQEALWDRDETLLTGQGRWPVQVLQEQQQAERAENNTDWEQLWDEATGMMPTTGNPSARYTLESEHGAGIDREITLHLNGSAFYSNILNCPEAAFHTALSTFKARTAQFGISSAVVQDWLEAQQMVLDNCGGPGEIPAPLPATAPAIARADRAYQIAAAHFYAGDYDQAASEFRAIGEDSSSPWSTVAPYLVARALVRKATLAGFRPDLPTLAQAEAQLESVLANPRMSKYHQAAEQLRGYVEFRLHPRNRLAELANRLTDARGDPDLAQDATDFELLSPTVTGRFTYMIPPPVGTKLYSSLADIRAKSVLLDWILTLQLSTPDAYNHSLEKWEHTRSLVWLVAALTKASPDSANLRELMAASQQVLPSSPAYASVTFESLRLMLLQGQKNRASERLAHLQIRHLGPTPAEHTTPPSAVNLFLALRFRLAQSLNELFENAPRVAATITNGDSNRQMPEPIWVPDGSFDPNAPRLDGDSLTVFNRLLPVAVLAKAALRDC